MAHLRNIMPLNILTVDFITAQCRRRTSENPTLPCCYSCVAGLAACLVFTGMLTFGKDTFGQQPPPSILENPSPQEKPSPQENPSPQEQHSDKTDLPPEQAAQIKQLIEQLGSPSFSEREKSAIALFKMGVIALPQLRLTLESTSDPELRERTQQLITRLTDGRLEEQITDFLAMKDIKFDGWIPIRNILGEDSIATRVLFVELMRKHPTLPGSMLGTPRDRTLAIEAIIGSIQATQLKQMPTTADAFALLLPILDLQVEMPSACEDLVIGILQKVTASNIRRDPRLSPSFKALLGHWMSRTTITNREDVLFFGLEWKLENATRELALATIADDSETGVTIQGSALQALAMVGVRSDVMTVRRLLDDTREVTGGSTTQQGIRIRNQLGDLAIATIASIYKVALDDVGFTGVKNDKTFGYFIDEIGFPEGKPEERKQAHAMIDAILRAQTQVPVPPDASQDRDAPQK